MNNIKQVLERIANIFSVSGVLRFISVCAVACVHVCLHVCVCVCVCVGRYTTQTASTIKDYDQNNNLH